jgi:hypothetical protein
MMSEQEPIVPGTGEGEEKRPAQPLVSEPRGLLLTAGEWLQRPPGKHMGLITVLVVLAIMFILILMGGR